ncbi:MAG: glycoside hydrolase family 2 [Bacteroidales bacterium]|nr:glycoside hydrolase family 2 [Bacteroidales bacterium]
MKRILFFLGSAGLLLAASCTRQRTVDLSGTWQVSLDSLATFQSISLPGTTDDAALGVPNTLEPAIIGEQIKRLTRKHSFLGAAFYKREFEIPKGMAGKPLSLQLERVLWQSSVWVDGMPLAGAEESLTTPHRYLIPDGLSAGRHTMLLRIDNRQRYVLNPSLLAHAYTNDTQIIWNGVLGEMSLTALEPVEIAQVDVYPDAAARTARVRTLLVRHAPAAASATLEYRSGGKTHRQEASLQGDTTAVEYLLELGRDAPLWDEFSPNLHTLAVRCGADSRTVRYGLRDFRRAGDHIEVNGRRIFLRGTLNCCIYPLTGTPPLDEAGWEKEFGVCREWGLNHIRFHSWCPPDAAFRVADRMGLYLQVELPDWARNIGEEDIDSFLKAEYDRIIAAYGNHPSFCMLTCGNELDRGYDWLNAMVRYMKEADPRHLYANSSYSMGVGHKGYPEPEDQFMVASRTYLGQIRGQDYLGSESPDFTRDYAPYTADFDVPLISHEIGQYSVFPHLSEIDKYTGVLEPLNFKGVRNILESKGMLDKAEDWTMASGRLGAILYKEEIERALKTPRLSGFQLLGLQDFSGQSTALVGLVDAFWDNKGLVSEAWFRQACAPVTPLVRFSKPWWTGDELFSAGVEIANYGPEDLQANVVWSLKDGEMTVAEGVFENEEIPTGGNAVLTDRIRADLAGIREPRRLSLTVGLEGTPWSNSWSVWVYPAEGEDDPGEVTIARTFKEALPVLRQGGTVLLNPEPAAVRGEKGKFVPVFWSPVFFPREAGTMGLLCDPSHPALSGFPTAMHSDWQWWWLTLHARAINLDTMAGAAPIVEAVDNFTQNRRLAYLFETQCESGRLLFCSMDLSGAEAAARPEVQALRRSLLDYMNSAQFHPEGRTPPADLEELFRPEDPQEWWREFQKRSGSNSGAAPDWTHEPGRIVPAPGNPQRRGRQSSSESSL